MPMKNGVVKSFLENKEFAYIRYSPISQLSSSAGQAVFMLHGFPGNRSCRNEDVGELIAEKMGLTVFLLHYRGLGRHEGLFSFSSTIEQAGAALRSLKDDFRSWIFIGHSWGGLVAVAMARQISEKHIKKILLLSPFNVIPSGRQLRDILREMQLEEPEIIGHYSLEELVNDLEYIRQTNDPRSNLVKLNLPKEKLHILQACNDEVVHPKTTESLVNFLDNRLTYEVLNDDHSFLTNRVILRSRILQILDI